MDGFAPAAEGVGAGRGPLHKCWCIHPGNNLFNASGTRAYPRIPARLHLMPDSAQLRIRPQMGQECRKRAISARAQRGPAPCRAARPRIPTPSQLPAADLRSACAGLEAPIVIAWRSAPRAAEAVTER
ncbi:hypothetical protein GCM10010530_49710 [Kribbella aluminosa]